MKKILSILLCMIFILSIFAGCSSNSNKLDIIYPISGNITSYDPQVASTADEYLVDENCYEGLVRVDDAGNVTPGVATNWTVSADNLTYTFTLREGIKWHIGTEAQKLLGKDFDPNITANDFVFALRRAVDPAMQCPLSSTLSSIGGAANIIAGKSSTDTLAVTATSDYSLTITLSSPDTNIMSTLSSSIAMPCNEQFFNATNGRYGLGSSYTISNGPFYVSTQLENSYILKSSDVYVGENKTKVTDITLNVVDNTVKNADADMVDKIESGYYDAAFLKSSQYATLDKESGITSTPYSNITWAFMFNCANGTLSEKKIRQALSLSLSYPSLEGKDYFANATGVTPPCCTADGAPITNDTDNAVPARNIQQGTELWKEGLKKTGASAISLTIITTDSMNNMAKELIQGIQSGIGKVSTYGDDNSIAFSLKIETMTEADLKTAVSTGNYDIALYPLQASSQSPVSFISDLAANNYTGFSSKSFDKALDNALKSTASTQREACLNCEKALISTYAIMPVLYESSYYACAKGVSGINFHPGSGRVSFINATREK